MASIAGSRNLFREKELQGSVAADPRGDPCVQQVNGKKDWAFSRDLLNWESSFLLPAQYSLLLSGLKAAGMHRRTYLRLRAAAEAIAFGR